MMTAKHPLSYGSIKKLVSVSVSNGSGWGGDIMNFEKQQAELVLLNRISKDELAEVVAELIKNDQEVQRAIINLAFSCPNIVTQI